MKWLVSSTSTTRPSGTPNPHSYILCEINVSSVSPFPDEAVGVLAEAVLSRLALTR
jgi:hypothetical protein